MDSESFDPLRREVDTSDLRQDQEVVFLFVFVCVCMCLSVSKVLIQKFVLLIEWIDIPDISGIPVFV